MRRERKQKRKFICWIAQLFNLRESSTFFSPLKKRKYESQLLQHGLQIMLVERRNCQGREKREKERKFPCLPGEQHPTPVLHWMHSAEDVLWKCRLEPQWDTTGALEHLACYSSVTKTCYWSLFLEGLLWIEPSVRLRGLALFYQNCSVSFMNRIAKHYLSTFQKTFYFFFLSLSRAVTKPL